ncbi:protein ANTAGONIST OF LIKE HETEROCHROMATIN PROTEIN 1-like [Temnothorax curvispinosus]|uniref:Protein ANTAGONIST OF LIKE HETEROCHROMATIN PROTEIN 1-like n=1 Tax=Temnothorax curvispinosus TaxID=300111 RepID=A0A6J1PLM5_9HYME|nr:protein ANTAGONIST OF LIKE HETEROCHROMATIN PROTEIN 1-like [Temnothorax curvispinosus]XP_024870242.1 protein ANTAGONIST OF LIKE HETEROCHROMATIN PROTEIN 1-like [Temnothorax curvispinosus]XP_024870251.1 protein ANTAGONIST OF LIKE HETEROCHROMATIN PROTEIN 1-like [Temnothorax curvispinosus]
MDPNYLQRLRINIRKKKKICALLGFLIINHYYESNLRRRTTWVKPWVARRKDQGCHHNLFLELQLEDPDKFRRCLRMSADIFEDLVTKVTPLIQRQDTHLRESISPAERLSVTLRHLATGESQESLSMNFRLGQSTISGIIKDTCRALKIVLQDDYLQMPDSEDAWEVVAQDFADRWNFPHCLGAMDGKHCRIDPPLQSGSLYYNYKETFSIVLLALVDAQLRYIYIDVGTNGRVSDKGVWNKCTFKNLLDRNKLKIPEPSPLPETDNDFPFVIVGDEGFTLSETVLIPFPKEQCSGNRDKRTFNYRVSRARRCSENAFGVMGSRFQIFRSPMRYDPDDARDIIIAICCLHNMLRTDVIGRAMYTPSSYIDVENEEAGHLCPGDWRNEQARGLVNFRNQGGYRHANRALALREMWCEYFNGVGAVPWQDRAVDH